MKQNQRTNGGSDLVFRVCIAGGIVVLNFVLMGYIHKQSSALKGINEQRTKFRLERQIITSADQITSRYAQEIASLSAVFPDESSMTNFLKILEKESTPYVYDYSVKFSSQSPLDEQGKMYIPLVVSFHADNEGLQNFLLRLEQLPYITHVTTLFTKIPEDNRTFNEVQVGIKVYVQKAFSTQ